ncbi:MAG: hypothetical protein ACFFCQ_05100 [Promethearchaeota archaeon]
MVDTPDFDYAQYDSSEDSIGNWLSLKHFPADTRINLTKRGRHFVFQNPRPPHISSLISPVQWSRYRSNLEMSVPMSVVHMLLNENDQFVLSFTVVTLGSQKTQLSIRLPAKRSTLVPLVALMCLTKGIFHSGTFQSEEESKTNAFIESFHDAFGVRLTSGENKRGFYLKVPQQLCSAIVMFFTGQEDASVPAIIRAIENCPEEEILSFLNTWFSHSRIYRRPNERSLFTFRVNEETQAIVKLLRNIGIEYEDGSITVDGEFVPVYVVLDTVENAAILNLFTEIEAETSKRELLEQIAQLRVRVKAYEEKIRMLEDLITELKEQIEETRQKKLQFAYSKYYFEKQTTELREKVEELIRVQKELRKENEAYKERLKLSKKHLPKEHSVSSKPEKLKTMLDTKAEIADLREELSRIRTTVDGLRSGYNIRIREREVQMTPSDQITANYLTAYSEELKSIFSALLSIQENWVILALASGAALTKTEIERFSSLSGIDLRRILGNLHDLGLLREGPLKDNEKSLVFDTTNAAKLFQEFRDQNITKAPIPVRALIKRNIPAQERPKVTAHKFTPE